MHIITVSADGFARWASPDGTQRCVPAAIGKGGFRREKREGDGATPIGQWPLRRVLYRPDRLPPPQTPLPLGPLTPNDGWCDDPAHPAYNQPVTLPFSARHEVLWRDDGVYDLIVILGHNDSPPIPGHGSAIFLHLARPGYIATEGCIALSLEDLLQLLAECGDSAEMIIEAQPPLPSG